MITKSTLAAIIAFALHALYTMTTVACLLGDDYGTLLRKTRYIVPLEELKDNLTLKNGCEYIIEVHADERIGSVRLYREEQLNTYSTNPTVTIKGIDTRRVISGSFNLIGVTLVLDDNITLMGSVEVLGSGYVGFTAAGVFIMNTGSAITSNSGSYYGGVYVSDNGTFIMNGGTISGNTATASGGGVYVGDRGTFIMNGGTISDNTASSSTNGGGGVYVRGGTFTMYDGIISGNTSSSSASGGGVHIGRRNNSYMGGIFTMNSGTISGNTASSSGGGVYVSYGSFYKNGGTIYGYSASDTVNSNAIKDDNDTVKNGYGHAAYARISDSSEKRKETTAWPTVNLFFISNGNFSGGWDY